MEDDDELDQCPSCMACWGIEEISFQECDSCGYPDDTEDIDCWDDDFDDE